MNTDCIAARLADLTAKRAAIPDDGTLPASTTRAELAVIQQRRRDADRELANVDAAVATWRALGSTEADERWRDQLTAWRQTLCDELLTIKSPIRDKVVMGRSINLSLSIKAIDFGPEKLEGSGYGLTNLKLGDLMRASGYEPVGEDLNHNYVGVMPWYGSLKEVEQRLAALGTQRAQAEANLEAALMTDEERAARDQQAAAERDAFNAMTVKTSPDSNRPGLVAYRADGEVMDISEMTPLQRTAFEKMNALHQC
jgi:hypothetical protein